MVLSSPWPFKIVKIFNSIRRDGKFPQMRNRSIVTVWKQIREYGGYSKLKLRNSVNNPMTSPMYLSLYRYNLTVVTIQRHT